MHNATPTPCITGKASLKPVECHHLTWNEGLPDSQEIFLLLKGFHGHCVYAGYLKYRYGSPLVGITASSAVYSERHSWCNSHNCRVWNHFLADLSRFCCLGVEGVGSACLESKIPFPRVRLWGGCHSWWNAAAGWAGTTARHVRWDTASCSGTARLTCCLAVSVDVFRRTRIASSKNSAWFGKMLFYSKTRSVGEMGGNGKDQFLRGVISVKAVCSLLWNGLGELFMPVEQYKQVIICNTFRLYKWLTDRAVTQLGKTQSLVLDV